MSVQSLREQRAAIGASVKALIESPNWNEADDTPKYDAMMAEIDAIDARIKRIADANEKLAAETQTQAVAAAAERLNRDNRDGGMALYAKWLRGGDKALNAEEWQQVRATMSTTTAPARWGSRG